MRQKMDNKNVTVAQNRGTHRWLVPSKADSCMLCSLVKHRWNLTLMITI